MKPKAYYEVNIDSELTIIPFKNIKEITYGMGLTSTPRVVFSYIGSKGHRDEAGDTATKIYNAYKEWLDSQ